MSDNTDMMTLGLIAAAGYILVTRVIDPVQDFFGHVETDPNKCGYSDPWCESQHRCMSLLDRANGKCHDPPAVPPPVPTDSHGCLTDHEMWCTSLKTCMSHAALGMGMCPPEIVPPIPDVAPPVTPNPIFRPNPNKMDPRVCGPGEYWCPDISFCLRKGEPCGTMATNFEGDEGSSSSGPANFVEAAFPEDYNMAVLGNARTLDEDYDFDETQTGFLWPTLKTIAGITGISTILYGIKHLITRPQFLEEMRDDEIQGYYSTRDRMKRLQARLKSGLSALEAPEPHLGGFAGPRDPSFFGIVTASKKPSDAVGLNVINVPEAVRLTNEIKAQAYPGAYEGLAEATRLLNERIRFESPYTQQILDAGTTPTRQSWEYFQNLWLQRGTLANEEGRPVPSHELRELIEAHQRIIYNLTLDQVPIPNEYLTVAEEIWAVSPPRWNEDNYPLPNPDPTTVLNWVDDIVANAQQQDWFTHPDEWLAKQKQLFAEAEWEAKGKEKQKEV